MRNSGTGFLFLIISGVCFYFVWQIFQTAERTNMYILQACGNAAKGLGQDSLSYYSDCVSKSSTGVGGAYLLIILGIILGIIGLVNLAKSWH